MRPAYGKALVELGAANPNVVALSADVSNSDFSYMFQEAYPDRFYNVGIAEQSLVDVAAGLAYAGKIPFANTFAFLVRHPRPRNGAHAPVLRRGKRETDGRLRRDIRLV